MIIILHFKMYYFYENDILQSLVKLHFWKKHNLR